ncbi:MAG: hypothetical protein ACC618_00095 [Patescibacteria group bacterium]
MSITVKISDFRNNLADYLDLVREKGESVLIKDGRRDEVVGELVRPKEEEFDWDEYMKFVKNFKPVFTDKDVEDIKKARKATSKRMRELDW